MSDRHRNTIGLLSERPYDRISIVLCTWNLWARDDFGKDHLANEVPVQCKFTQTDFLFFHSLKHPRQERTAMDMITFLKTHAPNVDVHVVEDQGGFLAHVGYYFWENGPKHHALQLIRDMRLEIGLDPMDIRQMCAEAMVLKVVIDGESVNIW